MRATAGWLLLVSIGLLVKDVYTPASMPNACCCAAMAGMASGAACPFKSQSHQACDEHGRADCSLGESDANTGAQNRRAPDSLEPSTLTEVESLIPKATPVHSLTSPAGAHPTSRNPLPETPPPRG